MIHLILHTKRPTRKVLRDITGSERAFLQNPKPKCCCV